MLDGANAGRMIVHRTREALQLVDIALLPRHRNAGIGKALMQRLFGEAAATKKPLRLQRAQGQSRRRGSMKGSASPRPARRNCTWKWNGALPPPSRPNGWCPMP